MDTNSSKEGMIMNRFDSRRKFDYSSSGSSRFTRENETNKIEYVKDRPVILVSSTSWSEDENFALLFDALKSKITRIDRQVFSIVICFFSFYSIWFK